MADWDAVWREIEPSYEKTVALALARYPRLVGAARQLGPIGQVSKFAAMYGFMYESASQRFEDLIWESARGRFEAGCGEVLATTQTRSSRVIRNDPAPCEALSSSAGLIDAGTDREGLTLRLVCASAAQFWEAEEQPSRVFPGVEERDAVGFEVLVNPGFPLGMLRPALLPEDAEHELLAYVERALIYATGHVELMLSAPGASRRAAP